MGFHPLFGVKPIRVQPLLTGFHAIYVPAGAMRPTVSNGCASLVDVETTAGRPDMQVLDFDASADEHSQFGVGFPSSWNEGPVRFAGYWTTAGAVSTGIAMGLQGVAVADGETIDVAYGTAVVVTDDAQGTAEDLIITDVSADITLAGLPATSTIGRPVRAMSFFRLLRDVSDGNDDMTQDMRLLGVQVLYKVIKGTDT